MEQAMSVFKNSHIVKLQNLRAKIDRENDQTRKFERKARPYAMWFFRIGIAMLVFEAMVGYVKWSNHRDEVIVNDKVIAACVPGRMTSSNHNPIKCK